MHARECARFRRAMELDRRKAACAAHTGPFNQNLLVTTLKHRETGGQRSFPLGAQSGGAGFDETARQLRHSGGWCPFSGTERENMEIGEAGLVDKVERVVEHLVAFSRETGDQIGTEGGIGP